MNVQRLSRQAQPFKACQNNTNNMDVNFKYNNAPINKCIGVIIESVVSEIPGGVLLKESKNATAFVTPGVVVTVDSTGDYVIATKSNISTNIPVGVLGSYYDADEGDKMVRLITVGVVNVEAVVAANDPNFDVVDNNVAEKIQGITFNPPTALAKGGGSPD